MISTIRSQDKEGPMTPERMMRIIVDECDEVKEDKNVVEFTFRGVQLVLVYDVNADRMRIISVVCDVENLKPDELQKAMEANFHSALDARYAISNDTVWAAFIHPLEEMTERLLRSAIRQVAMAKVTFGEEYSSGELYFGG